METLLLQTEAELNMDNLSTDKTVKIAILTWFVKDISKVLRQIVEQKEVIANAHSWQMIYTQNVWIVFVIQ